MGFWNRHRNITSGQHSLLVCHPCFLRHLLADNLFSGFVFVSNESCRCYSLYLPSPSRSNPAVNCSAECCCIDRFPPGKQNRLRESCYIKRDTAIIGSVWCDLRDGYYERFGVSRRPGDAHVPADPRTYHCGSRWHGCTRYARYHQRMAVSASPSIRP